MLPADSNTTRYHAAPPPPPSLHLDEGTAEDPQEILWEQAALSVSSALWLMYWAVVRARWRLQTTHNFRLHAPPPPTTQWNHFLKLCLEVLVGWLKHPNPPFP